MIFLALSGKMIFLFPKIWSYSLGKKWKMIFLKKKKKNTWKYDILFKCSEKMVFSERSSGNIVFLVLSGKTVFFFFPKMWCFFFGQKMKDNLSQEIRGGTKFLYIPTSVTNLTSRPPAKKNQRWSYPAKIHLKVTEILDLHSKKSSNNSLYFYGDLYRRFHTLLSSEKTRKLSI